MGWIRQQEQGGGNGQGQWQWQWQVSVPRWEKDFCMQVPWQKVVEMKKYMDLYKNIFQWNDSAGKEAFDSAKSRFWAESNGLPTFYMPLPDVKVYYMPLPDPDLYIDDIDWNADSNYIDPELILDLERSKEPKPSHDDHGETLDQDHHEVVVLGLDALHLNQWRGAKPWGDEFADDQDLRNKENIPENPCGKNADKKEKNPWESAASVRYQSNASVAIGGGWNNNNMYYYGRADDHGVSNCGNFNSYDTANSYGTGGSWYNNSRYRSSRFDGGDYYQKDHHGGQTWRNGGERFEGGDYYQKDHHGGQSWRNGGERRWNGVHVGYDYENLGVSSCGNFKSDTANYSRKRSYGTGDNWYNNSRYKGSRIDGSDYYQRDHGGWTRRNGGGGGGGGRRWNRAHVGYHYENPAS